jgi:hypothetical protein
MYAKKKDSKTRMREKQLAVTSTMEFIKDRNIRTVSQEGATETVSLPMDYGTVVKIIACKIFLCDP